LNLPAADKMVEPYFTMLWDEDLPRHVVTNGNTKATTVTVIAGELAGLRPPPPPPDSWASRAEADLAIWHLQMGPGAVFALPPAAAPDTVRVLYVFAGTIRIGEHDLEAPVGARVRVAEDVNVAGGPDGAEVLVLQGRPIGEPVVQEGPFVMNDRAGIVRAFTDYRETGFGGWPWADDGPVHGRTEGRFARRPDGAVDLPPAVSAVTPPRPTG
jgi:quercetin 2,3-dioxygenase